MPVFSGTTSSTATEVANNIPSGVLSFSVVNRSGGNVALNIYIGEASAYVMVVPYNLLLNDGDTVYNDSPIKVLANKNILITSTGSIDYYFSIE